MTGIVGQKDAKTINGYRELSEKEIDLINESKELEKQVNKFINWLDEVNNEKQGDIYFNARNLAIAKTNIETGFMFLVKAIAKPTHF
jgi:hypothetical protein